VVAQKGVGSIVAPRDRSGVVKVLAIATVAVAAVLVLWWTGTWEYLWELFSDRERLQQAVEGAGPLAPAVFVLLLAAQAVLAPLPAPAVAFAGGYVFGTLWGFVLTWLGVLLGGTICFWISRFVGRGFVERSTRLKGLDHQVEEHGAIMVFVLRLIPLISFDAISYAAGLTGIGFWRFLLATALGAVPGTFVFVYLGGASSGPGLYTALVVLAVLAVLAYAYFRRLRRS
jgi:uncharacterized membrane protein YdjX (TVP38/TMEM64 family)